MGRLNRAIHLVGAFEGLGRVKSNSTSSGPFNTLKLVTKLEAGVFSKKQAEGMYYGLKMISDHINSINARFCMKGELTGFKEVQKIELEKFKFIVKSGNEAYSKLVDIKVNDCLHELKKFNRNFSDELEAMLEKERSMYSCALDGARSHMRRLFLFSLLASSAFCCVSVMMLLLALKFMRANADFSDGEILDAIDVL